jgi:heme/copper-type cytochrome/quinol oxidase subunit 3
MTFASDPHPSQTQPAHLHTPGTHAAQGSPSPDRLDAAAPSGVSESHPLLHEKTRLAVLLFLASEFVFFVFLVVAYIYSQPSEIHGPTAHSSLVPWKTGIYTVILLASSATIYMAERMLDVSRKKFALWMGVTVVLGATFLFGEMREYAGLLHKDITISRNLFGSTYFTLTGFHAIHVTLGLLMLLTILGLVLSGKLGSKRHTAFRAVSYYWHFVDIVWVMVFSVIYLWSAR